MTTASPTQGYTFNSGVPWAPPPPRPPGPPSLGGLPEFLDAVRELLRKIIFEWDELLIAEERRQALQDAFVEVNPVFDTLIDKVAATYDLTAQQKLVEVGLAGKQLEMKLGKGRSLWERFWRHGGRKWLGRLLGWINKILESLAAAIPGGHAIKELKDAVEEELKDTD
jgi:hypothetical protein